MLWSGEWAWRHEPVETLSEVENRSRGHQALERGGELPNGGVRPSSEVVNHPRGTTAGRLVGCCGFFGPWAFPLWAATTWSMFFRV
jgi:hypothetical protein